jgi:glycosyltransferase involved in cell wall biosynthesis
VPFLSSAQIGESENFTNFLNEEAMQAEARTKLLPAAGKAALRVAFDAQALISNDGGTGKGVQLRNLVDSRWAEFQGFAPPDRLGRSTPGIVQGGTSRYLLWQQASLPQLVRSWKPDIFLAPYNTAPLFLPSGTKLVLVLHDLIIMQKAEGLTLKNRVLNSYKRRLVAPSVARASYVLTVSEFSRDRILESFPKARVVVIPCTISESWFLRAKPAPLEERENYILLVTAAPPHKNTARALRAYAAYAKGAGAQAPKLRIVGLSLAGQQFPEMVRNLGLTDRVIFEPLLSTHTLQGLYRRAKAVLVPSLMEGFGIPVLEGMASGTPVITSRTSSLAEVGGDAVQFFDPLNEHSIAASIMRLIEDPTLWSELAEKGQRQAAKFNPESVHRQIDRFWRGVSGALHLD